MGFFFQTYLFLQVFTSSPINTSWLNTVFAHTTVLQQRYLLAAARKGLRGSVKCSTIYSFQKRTSHNLLGNRSQTNYFTAWLCTSFKTSGLLLVILGPGLHKFAVHRNGRFAELEGSWDCFQLFCLGLSTLTLPCSLAQQLKWSHLLLLQTMPI